MTNQIEYYKKRAKEYEKIYQKVERQSDLKKIKEYLSDQFIGKEIIEIACGTGYWTTILANNAKSITGIDTSQEVLAIAKSKKYPNKNVTFKQINYKALNSVDSFDGLFGGFIWSHILKEELHAFLVHLLSLVRKGSELIFIDNKYVEGSSTPISRVDEMGNTYQNRTLETGAEYEVIKNFPEKEELTDFVSTLGHHITYFDLDYYWILKFKK